MPASRSTAQIEARCRAPGCGRWFAYRSELPDQHFCRECYYERREDFMGALDERAWREGYEHATEVLGDRAERAAKLLDLLPLRDVIALCHPDRHPAERRDQATAVTAALLELRERLA